MWMPATKEMQRGYKLASLDGLDLTEWHASLIEEPRSYCETRSYHVFSRPCVLGHHFVADRNHVPLSNIKQTKMQAAWSAFGASWKQCHGWRTKRNVFMATILSVVVDYLHIQVLTTVGIQFFFQDVFQAC